MTFKERYLRGDCPLDVLNDWVEVWQANGLDYQKLPSALGLTEGEYRLWAIAGDEALAKQLAGSVDTPYAALHLDWDDLTRRLKELVQSLLGAAYKLSVRRTEYYYWDLQIQLPYGTDEEDSGKICELLELEEMDPDDLFWSGKIGNSQLNGLLSKLTRREVISNHADDYGVWLICKDKRLPAKEGI